MNSFLKNYGSTLALLAGLAAGGIIGICSSAAATAVKPVGDLFLNLIFVIIVPLVFFSIAASIYNMRESNMLGRVLGWVMVIFAGMSMVAAAVSYLGCLIYNPVGEIDHSKILGTLTQQAAEGKSSIPDIIVRALTVPDFHLLLTKSNLLPLIIFAALWGYGTSAAGEKGKPMAAFINSGTEVVMKMMSAIMVLAPVGLGCYFAGVVDEVGSQFLGGYIRAFVLYIAILAVFFFGINSIYVLVAKGGSGLKAYWKHIITPSITAIATSSSAATMPVAIEAVKKMGVTPSIADAVIPLGTNIHKDGSVMTGVIKAAFLMCLFSRSLTDPGTALAIVAVAIISAVVLGAVPSGGMAGEIFICSMLGFSPEMVGIIIVLGTLYDLPATLLNSSANIVGAILVDTAVGAGKKNQ